MNNRECGDKMGRKKKKEEEKEEPIIVEVKEIEAEKKSTDSVDKKKKKKKCKNCSTENDIDAKYCKNCGKRLFSKIEKEGIYFLFNRIFKILSLVIAIDLLFLVRPHFGTSTGDYILICYILLLVLTLILATFCRIMSEGVTFEKIKKNKFKMTKTTQVELGVIILLFMISMVILIHTNTRIMYIKPGNSYIDKKVEKYVSRWRDTKSYVRTGVRRCPSTGKIFNKIPKYDINCYEYTYRISFKNGDTCFLKYRSRQDHKMNQETFSYCDR